MTNRPGLSYRFRNAIVRPPGLSVSQGLRAVDQGEPDLSVYQAEHASYVRALENAGLKVHPLKQLEAYPDSVFVEDTALCLPQGIIILRPGAPSRRGEADEMALDCKRLAYPLIRLQGPGNIDGGDILVTDREILVGASERTDQNGFDELASTVSNWGYTARLVQTPVEVLHFKSDCSVLGPDTILATGRLAAASCFEDYTVLMVPEGEEPAANSIRINDAVLVPDGHPKTVDLLSSAGFNVVQVPATQAALLDGGLSCQSLRF